MFERRFDSTTSIVARCCSYLLYLFFAGIDGVPPKPSVISPINNNNEEDELLQRKGLSPAEKAKRDKKYQISNQTSNHTYMDELESTLLAAGKFRNVSLDSKPASQILETDFPFVPSKLPCPSAAPCYSTTTLGIEYKAC